MTARLIAVLAVLLMALGGVAPDASAQVVRWAGRVNASRPEILHAPDNRWTGLDPPLTISDFGPEMVYSGLAELLGVAESELARADVIAFELNGNAPAGVAGGGSGWESAVWTFSDGVNSHVVTFNENDPPSSYGPPRYPSVVANGSIRGADGQFASGGARYSKFFGMCCPRDKVISFILFDLHTHLAPKIDVRDPRFWITIATRPSASEEGTPEPDAVGVFSSCPKACP